MGKLWPLFFAILCYLALQSLAVWGVITYGPSFGLKPTEIVAAGAVTVSLLGSLYTSIVTLLAVQWKYSADAQLEDRKLANATELERTKSALADQQRRIEAIQSDLRSLRAKCNDVHQSLKRLEAGKWDPSIHAPLHDEVRKLYDVAEELERWGLLEDHLILHRFHQGANFVAETAQGLQKDEQPKFWRETTQEYVAQYEALRDALAHASDRMRALTTKLYQSGLT